MSTGVEVSGFGDTLVHGSSAMYTPMHEYYFLLALVLIPVYLFFRLWSWLGWELFVNN